MTIDQLIAELQRLKEEGVSGGTKLYVDATTFPNNEQKGTCYDFTIKQDANLEVGILGALA